MLKSLSINNYALIESLDIDFPEGLVIITGETGAGKSILMGALSLLLGNKADSDTLKNPEKNCIVEALFSKPQDEEMNELLLKEGIDADQDLVLRRVVTPSGKSRNFVNDQPVSLQFLKSISGKIIDIHAQHQHLLLSDSRFQLSVLDSYSDNGMLLKQYAEIHRELLTKEADLTKARREAQSLDAENEFNLFQLKQLSDASLRAGELEELESEFKILSNAEEIKASLLSISTLLETEEFSVPSNLKEAGTISARISSNYPPAVDLASRIESCRIEINDILQETVMMADKISVSPERTAVVEERISEIYKLLKRHHLESVEELIALSETLSAKAENAANEWERVALLEKEIGELSKCRADLADELHKIRARESELFSEAIRESVRELEMPYAEFRAIIERSSQYSDTGNSSVKFLFSANRDVEPRELGKVASGGELSRIMLCLKEVLAKGEGMPTMIFDEIDTGVSGKIADKMGNLIMGMAKEMQIFAITHLPQIASKGLFHLLVYKETDRESGTRTLIKQIEGDERVKEIARMLSGTKTTSAALENARELLFN